MFYTTDEIEKFNETSIKIKDALVKFFNDNSTKFDKKDVMISLGVILTKKILEMATHYYQVDLKNPLHVHIVKTLLISKLDNELKSNKHNINK